MPNIYITSKGQTYRRQLNEVFGTRTMSNQEMDDWDVLFELESRIRQHGSASAEDIVAMIDRSQGLGSGYTSVKHGHGWDDEELRSDVRSSLRRLFEEGYISYA